MCVLLSRVTSFEARRPGAQCGLRVLAVSHPRPDVVSITTRCPVYPPPKHNYTPSLREGNGNNPRPFSSHNYPRFLSATRPVRRQSAYRPHTSPSPRDAPTIGRHVYPRYRARRRIRKITRRHMLRMALV
ncbi:hypothetical protein LZ32DRAFT_131672 [Colletotrichum eremochloae]|nr:hypothetical protein LZ32DRAFT_131672 [Colletotrichum eremochloae]